MANSLAIERMLGEEPLERRITIATSAALILHLAGAIGIIWFERDWFIAMTPLNLFVMFLFLLWTDSSQNKIKLYFLIAAWALGMASEMIGVNTGILYGHYAYTDVLGPKILGVPLLIGCNWFMILKISSSTVYWVGEQFDNLLKSKNILPSNGRWQIIAGALLATGFDWIMEPVAVSLRYWIWLGDGDIPLLNYITWFFLSLLLLWIAVKMKFIGYNPFSTRLFFIQLVFFLALSYLS